VDVKAEQHKPAPVDDKVAGTNSGKPLTTAAARALAEAQARRAAQPVSDTPAPKERAGPKGPEPTRYGDWEKNGIASDF
jgi:hypothetical protein